MAPVLLIPAVVTGNVADPEWGWPVMLYFFLGGIAGGAFLMAAVSDLFADADNRPVARVGYLLAFPLIVLCGLLLIVDLKRPERFWHMLWNVTTNQPSFKYWSPISYGSWILTGIGLFSFLAFVLELAPRWSGLRGLAGLRAGPVGKAIAAVGALFALLFVSYTGVLLNVTNQRIWGDNTLLGPLFAASGISTGIAAIALLLAARRQRHRLVLERLERADLFTIVVELLLLGVLIGWLASLDVAGPLIGGGIGVALWVGVVLLGLLVPLVLYLRPRLLGTLTPIVASSLALVGGLILRAVIVLAAHA